MPHNFATSSSYVFIFSINPAQLAFQRAASSKLRSPGAVATPDRAELRRDRFRVQANEVERESSELGAIAHSRFAVEPTWCIRSADPISRLIGGIERGG